MCIRDSHQGALAMTDRGVGYYVQLSTDGLMTGGGFNAAGPDQTCLLYTSRCV